MPTDLLDKKEVRIRRMFDRIAPWYDFLNHLLSLNVDTHWRNMVARLVPPTPGKPALDLCTGTGDLAFTLDRAAKKRCQITASDFSPEMLVLARKKGEKRGTAGRIEFVEADAQHLPFPADHYDLVTCSFGLRNITDTARGLAEMVRVAAPGGRVAILEFSKPRGKILGPLYQGYFRRVLPRVGNLFAKNEDSAYKYLPESVLAFPDGEALAEKLRASGLGDVWFRPLTFGIATLYVGTKPAVTPTP
ncbi:MAG: bifunctional demethylmenaquinone methyltransferase/2-methoxy-6-polyprenyl-1,4-benzoquinol methylase UbiE [Gemmataceae bacterium]